MDRGRERQVQAAKANSFPQGPLFSTSLLRVFSSRALPHPLSGLHLSRASAHTIETPKCASRSPALQAPGLGFRAVHLGIARGSVLHGCQTWWSRLCFCSCAFSISCH